jgi:hypothetical protein
MRTFQGRMWIAVHIWPYLMLSKSILLIYILFYANDGYKEYIPRSRQPNSNLVRYLTTLKAWMRYKMIKMVWRLFIWYHHYKWKQALRRSTNRQSHCNMIHHIIVPQHGQLPETLQAWEVILAMESSANKSERSSVLDTDSKAIGIDNRCSAYLSGFTDDFVGELTPTDKIIKGFGGTQTKNVFCGTALIRIEDDSGRVHTFKLPNSYYVPGCNVRLLSPQHWSQQLRRQKRGPAFSTTTEKEVVLSAKDFTKTIPLDPSTNVATCRTAPGYDRFIAFCAEVGCDITSEITGMLAHLTGNNGDPEDPSDQQAYEEHGLRGGKDKTPVIDEADLNDKRGALEDELLGYHLRFGHAPFKKLQIMAREGVIPQRLAKCRHPICAACMFGKATKRPWRQKTPVNREEAYHPTRPGEIVSVDQLKSPTPGLIAQITGALTTKRYEYATVFVDNYSGYSFVFLQKTSSGEETLQAKEAFERLCKANGIEVQHYHADNGIFKANIWVENCRKNGQGLSFAGVNAHHQNGRAEARIRRLQELTRTQLSHAKRLWPQEISINLWPYAMRLANESINATPALTDRPHFRTPQEMFFKTKVATNPRHWYQFGCPVYVLDSKLQAGKPFHKWNLQRTKVGIYLGRSPQHSRSVALVLDVTTGLVSPQFHVRMDSWFDTIKQLYKDAKQGPSQWQIKAGFVHRSQETPKTSQPQVSPTTMHTNRSSTEQLPTTGPTQDRNLTDQTRTPDRNKPPPTRDENVQQTKEGRGDPNTSKQVTTTDIPTTPTNLRKSRRTKKPIQRLIEAMSAELESQPEIPGEIFSMAAMFPTQSYKDHGANPIFAFKAKADPDTLYLHQAMRQPDWNMFSEAMNQEIQQQVGMGVHTLIKRSEVPEGASILPAVWQLRRKRDIRTGKIKKYKARCNIDGSQMKYGEHYQETYAPVAGWTSIRLLLALVLLFQWKTVQLDYVLAFPQAPVERELYMELPKGFTVSGVDDPSQYVLRINKNIYGQKQAGRVWYQYLRKRLIDELGFKQSKSDECVFFKGQMIYVLYTDDSILAGPDMEEINKTVEAMKKADLNITIEGDLTDFLGVNIDRKHNDIIHLSQPKLIDQVLQDLRMQNDNVSVKTTPAPSSKLLSRHVDSPDFDKSFNYRSIIGKLNYLERGSRPDIAYAVHQCARFSIDPKTEHGKAVRWIARYLKGTKSKGMILKPDPTKSLEVYVDADFAGAWDKSLAGIDKDTARSRHGYIITYAGIPICWKSQLQQEIALSSTESEITGMSYALREAIPIIELLREIQAHGFSVNTEATKVHCKVFEDNSGAVEIAKFPKARPRTKHINNRLFHFYDYVERGDVSIHHIKSEEQPADFLTKPLPDASFIKHRKTIMGW